MILKKSDKKKGKFIYGPVPSRRLGLSLGVDTILNNTCSYDCIYCQLGRTLKKTFKRKPYVCAELILRQLYDKLDEGINADYITLAGSGEPALNSKIGLIIGNIKKHTKIPVAVITNSSFFSWKHVRESMMEADVILPSLDAYNQSMFEKINRPHKDILFDTMLEGIVSFKNEYKNAIWLEIFIINGINANEADAIKFKQLTDIIAPHKIHINTVMRPSAEKNVQPATYAQMNRFCEILGKKAQVIVPFNKLIKKSQVKYVEEDILNMIKRRPCTLEDISCGLNVGNDLIYNSINLLIKKCKISVVQQGTSVYYRAKSDK